MVLFAFKITVHSEPGLMRDILGDLLLQLHNEMQKRKEHGKEVEPFKPFGVNMVSRILLRSRSQILKAARYVLFSYFNLCDDEIFKSMSKLSCHTHHRGPSIHRTGTRFLGRSEERTILPSSSLSFPPPLVYGKHLCFRVSQLCCRSWTSWLSPSIGPAAARSRPTLLSRSTRSWTR